MSSISNVSSGYLQSLLSSINPTTSASSTNNTLSGSLDGTSVSSLNASSDGGQLSPFAELLSTLQNLQQSNPTEYKSVMSQISTNLTNAAQTETSAGDTNGASELTQLATDFSSASQSGDLPNIQDLAQAVGGPGDGPPPPPGPPPGSDSSLSTDGSGATSTSSSTGSSSTSASSGSDSTSSSSISSLSDSLTAQILSGYANQSQNNALNPLSIIMSTLTSAGVISGS